MISALINRIAHVPPGGTAEAVFSHEGIGTGLAAILFLLVSSGAIWGYQRASAGIARKQRLLLASMRVLLVAIFVVLLIRPVLLLTVNEPVRERLLVLLDSSESMQIKDRRRTEEDQKRAAIAAGLQGPADGLKAPLPSGAQQLAELSRAELLRNLSKNDKLNLWPRLQEKADLFCYSIGSEARSLGSMFLDAGPGEHASSKEAASFFDRIQFSEGGTALGDSLQQVLEGTRGQPITGILMVTDGGNNSGAQPEEIAQIAKQSGIPLYIYGVGITAPKDVAVVDLSGPRGVFSKERAEFSVKIRSSGFGGHKANLQLKANGKKVAEKEITLPDDSEMEGQIGFIPEERGDFQIEAQVTPLEGEASKENNSVSAKLRVLGTKINLLYIEGEPRWDFRYLLATLLRDRRLSVKCLLLKGDADLADEPGSPFLKEFPAEDGDFLRNEVVILGDVDPQALGEARMKLIHHWVGDMGGGVIFLAGPKNNPFRYLHTPLEALLPVELDPGLSQEKAALRSSTPIRIKLSTAGELSPLFRLSEDTFENREIWSSFPGVRWTARVSRAKPNAEVYLADSRLERGTPSGPMPVIAQVQYGQGMAMYFGMDETYRWYSKAGEKYYARIWNQIIQCFALDRQLGASARLQLNAQRPQYLLGDKAVVAGKIYAENFSPLAEPSIPAMLTITAPGQEEKKSAVNLLAVPERPGEYRLEFTPATAGEYSLATGIDPNSVVRFTVASPNREQSETALNASLLRRMAEISGGSFLREEDLDSLPARIASRGGSIPRFKKIELYYSPWWMAGLMTCLCAEWLLRRIWRLR